MPWGTPCRCKPLVSVFGLKAQVEARGTVLAPRGEGAKCSRPGAFHRRAGRMARECGMLSPPETGELCSTASAEEAHALPPCPLEAPPARSQSPPACPDLLRCGGAGRGIAGLLGPGRIQYEYRGHTVFNEPQA